MNTNTSPMTDQELLDLRARNEARVKEKIQELGTKWLLHPSNAPVKKRSPLVSKNLKYLATRCGLG